MHSATQKSQKCGHIMWASFPKTPHNSTTPTCNGKLICLERGSILCTVPHMMRQLRLTPKASRTIMDHPPFPGPPLPTVSRCLRAALANLQVNLEFLEAVLRNAEHLACGW